MHPILDGFLQEEGFPAEFQLIILLFKADSNKACTHGKTMLLRRLDRGCSFSVAVFGGIYVPAVAFEDLASGACWCIMLQFVACTPACAAPPADLKPNDPQLMYGALQIISTCDCLIKPHHAPSLA